jgi:hypothetical protein
MLLYAIVILEFELGIIHKASEDTTIQICIIFGVI